MTYEEFLDTELQEHLSIDHYEPELGIVYAVVDTPFIYDEISYRVYDEVAYHLDYAFMRHRL